MEAGPGYNKCVYPEEDKNEITSWAKNQCNNIWSRSFLEKKLPVIQWLPTYSINFLFHDVLAGLNVALTAIPQGIAYAVVAGLEPQYGLYSGFMGPFTYILFGSCKDVTIGPTAILALMTQQYVEKHGPDFAVLLTFLSGCIILLLGLLNIGFLVDFISMPVIVGFTSASAVTIGSSQLKSLLGISGKSNDFLESWKTVVENIHETELWDSVLGFGTIIVLMALKTMNKYQRKGENLTRKQKILNKLIWLLSLGRNALVAIVGAAIAYILHSNGSTPFKLTGNIGSGQPHLDIPPFSSHYNNRTYEFLDMTSELGTTLATLPLISILGCVAIAKVFTKEKGLDTSQEIIALGVSNIAGSFVRSMPVTGSFTRSVVNNASGVKTQMGGLFTGAIIILALVLLTSTFYYLPKATLAGIIITAMFFMVECEVIPLLWRTKKIDLIPLFVTFFCCLFFSLEYGMLIGVGINLLFILYTTARPRVTIENIQNFSHEILLITPDQSLVFPAAEFVRKKIVKVCLQYSSGTIVILNGRHIHHIDATMAKALQLLNQNLKVREQRLVLWNWVRSSRETCLGLDPKMDGVFQEAESLEQLLRGLVLHTNEFHNMRVSEGHEYTISEGNNT
ncbi:sodium-independent sulfate anion transporter isoform X2 [Anabrus simplex]|uniref:sodium-independent sulfate anion transporter isoform X2 n=1 Tax=Anabrus simplex TaxID=316456 RepID=UPI0035A2E1B4